MKNPLAVQCQKTIFIMVQNKAVKSLFAIAFWLFVWQVAANVVGHRILLPSPIQTIKALFQLLPTSGFWLRVGFSLLKIAQGFALATVCGLAMAVATALCSMVEILFNPLVLLAKATPVASFIILALIWMPSSQLPVFISFLMVLPIIYTSVLQGIRQTDIQLLEMAKVFHIPFWRQIRAIYIPQVFPYFYSACSVSLGLAWKSGIAAEVIGLPHNTIGEALYEAKVFLSTDEMFAWTAIVVLTSVIFEKLVLKLLKQAVKIQEQEQQNADNSNQPKQTI